MKMKNEIKSIKIKSNEIAVVVLIFIHGVYPNYKFIFFLMFILIQKFFIKFIQI